jgi:hypothetical protein
MTPVYRRGAPGEPLAVRNGRAPGAQEYGQAGLGARARARTRGSAARRRGLSVPRDVSVVGFDDSPLIAFTDPPLTTLRQPVAAMGNAAIRQLVDEINGHGAPRSEYVFSPELVVRGSTAINQAGRSAESVDITAA